MLGEVLVEVLWFSCCQEVLQEGQWEWQEAVEQDSPSLLPGALH